MKEESDIYVTVCMPIYNGQKFLAQAIESVLNQTNKNFKLIISDDGSTDDTEKISLRYQNIDSRINYIKHKENRGANWNYKFVLNQVKTKYFTQLAQDDLLETNFLEETLLYIKSHPNCILVSGDFESIDEGGNHIRIENLHKIREDIPWSKRICEFFTYPVSKTFLCTYGLMETEKIRDIFSSIKYPKKTVKGVEMLQISRFSIIGEIVSIPKVLRKQRQHNNSMYNKEFLSMKNKNKINQILMNLKNKWYIRFEQMRVLWFSNLKINKKFYITFSIYLRYFLENLQRIQNLFKL